MSLRTTVVVLAVLAVVGLLALRPGEEGQLLARARPGGPGATTSLPELDGNGSGSVADYRGRWVLVNVWASWCLPCQSESPALERFYDANRGKDFTILGVDSNDLSTDGLKLREEPRHHLSAAPRRQR